MKFNEREEIFSISTPAIGIAINFHFVRILIVRFLFPTAPHQVNSRLFKAFSLY